MNRANLFLACTYEETRNGSLTRVTISDYLLSSAWNCLISSEASWNGSHSSLAAT